MNRSMDYVNTTLADEQLHLYEHDYMHLYNHIRLINEDCPRLNDK